MNSVCSRAVSADETPLLTIVIPAHRAERTIQRAIDSVMAQEGLCVRVIVVVDGNNDRTAERSGAYDPHRVLVVVNEINQGASRTRNRGLDLVSTPFVMFIDADDFVEGSFLAPLVQRMVELEADVGFGPLQILFEASGRRLPRFVPTWRTAAEVFRDWHANEKYVGTIGTMWRTEFVRRIGAWDPEITRNDDGELVMRAILKSARFVTSCSGQGVYVLHSTGSMNHRSDNMASMLLANDKLLHLETTVVSPLEHRRVCAEHYFNTACHAYLAGRDDVGDEALARSRSLGLKFKGPFHYRLAYRLLGPRRASLVVRWLKQRLQAALGASGRSDYELGKSA